MESTQQITKTGASSFSGVSVWLTVKRHWWRRDIRIKSYCTTTNSSNEHKRNWFFKFGKYSYQIEASVAVIRLDDGQMNLVTGILKRWENSDWRVMVQYQETCEPSVVGIDSEALDSMKTGLTVATNVLCCLHGKL